MGQVTARGQSSEAKLQFCFLVITKGIPGTRVVASHSVWAAGVPGPSPSVCFRLTAPDSPTPLLPTGGILGHFSKDELCFYCYREAVSIKVDIVRDLMVHWAFPIPWPVVRSPSFIWYLMSLLKKSKARANATGSSSAFQKVAVSKLKSFTLPCPISIFPWMCLFPWGLSKVLLGKWFDLFVRMNQEGRS